MGKGEVNCGSIHCQGGHTWIFENTQYARLDSINCGAHAPYTTEEMRLMNNCADLFGEEGKFIWQQLKDRKEGRS